MSKIISDTVEVTLTIAGNEWLLSEGKVELSREALPNYVDINKMAPNVRAESSFDNPNELIGEECTLSVNTDIISNRDTNAEEKKILFKGNIANISAVGTNVYECIVYDPAQQALNTAAKGHLLNQRIDLDVGREDYIEQNLTAGSITYAKVLERTQRLADDTVIKASKAVNRILDKFNVQKRDIQLTDSGKEISGPNGSFIGAYDAYVRLSYEKPTVRTALEQITERTNSRWWFDRKGVFHFGLPEPTIHAPQLITGTSAGLKTPPYQSVKIIGSGIASGTENSSNTYGRTNLNAEEPVVVAANIGLDGEGEPKAFFVPSAQYGAELPLNEPTFEYENRQIITTKQAENTAKKLVEDLKEQYATGKVTVVGFPEVKVFDVIIMPHSEKSKKDVGNYNPRQPMGGALFSVYKVVHKLNPTDGFVTDIHVAGMTTSASVLVSNDNRVSPQRVAGGLGGPASFAGGGSSGAGVNPSEEAFEVE